MKKLFAVLVVGLSLLVASCGQSSKELEAQRIADSIRVADSLSLVQAEQQRLTDSIAKAKIADSLKADSIQKAKVKKVK